MNLSRVMTQWFGKTQTLELAVAGLIAKGHLLIEGPPGVGKTHLSNLLSHSFALDSLRVQGTPDLMPSDVLGTHILSEEGQRKFHQGPIFCQLLQIDEINRITPRTLSAILEAMQDRQVSLETFRFALPTPFHIIATRSTREFEGVYMMPESALDRFIISLRVSLPESAEEFNLLKQTVDYKDLPEGILGNLLEHQNSAQQTAISDRIINRAIKIIRLSRDDKQLLNGAGVRATESFIAMAKALAFVRNTEVVTLNLLEELALAVMSHRLKPRYAMTSTKYFVDSYWKDSDPTMQLTKRFEGLIK